jgi:hypothetical protein
MIWPIEGSELSDSHSTVDSDPTFPNLHPGFQVIINLLKRTSTC